ncbi:MAG: hypothetical protein BRD54_06290 [Bacteroidetes bacterium SW_8_64_56]|jgi:hypothetical protein|nr:MAG: hypothetical protein BRD54_06290 [Bacteroidetes bacterium SW_8_64_56]
MRRLLRSVPLLLLAALLGVSTGFAQSSSVGPVTTSSSYAVDQVEEQPPVDEQSSEGASTLTHQEVADVMLNGNVGLDRGVAPKKFSPQFSDYSADSPLSQEVNGNRQAYYIIGGALVAGGLVAGILLLDGNGDGGDGRQGIPPPPGRP